MSSSTSSSDSRRVYARTLATIFVLALVALVVFRIMTTLFDASAETILGRVVEAREALPRIVAEEEDLVMVFGSSMVHAGFSARQFDRQMEERGAPVKSFNFGFGGLNPYFQDYLARRIREEFDAGGSKLELAVLEFNPFQTTTSRWQGALPAVDSFLVMLARPSELWQIALEDPTRGARLFNIKYLRNDISAEMTTHFFGAPLLPKRPRSSLPPDEELQERLDELGEELGRRFEEEYPDYDGSDWSWDWQGAGTIPEERSAETRVVFEEYYELLRSDRFLDDDRLNRIHCCDILELHFEPVLVEAYIRIVETFQQFSERVEVVMLPRNTDWIHYSPEARARLDAAIARIEGATGVEIQDFQTIDAVTPEMFSDTTHLSRYAGDVAFVEFLVDRYAPSLGGSVSPPIAGDASADEVSIEETVDAASGDRELGG